MVNAHSPLPPWLHKPLQKGSAQVQTTLRQCGLCTVCEEALCPNISECYEEKRATFLLLGPVCTRACGFCGVGFSCAPSAPDVNEPEKVAVCCSELGLRHVVLTMVTRDDMDDGGALHVVKTIRAVREKLPHVTVEVLTSDFGGVWPSVEMVIVEKPEVFAHNVETVQAISPKVRYKATYDGSLAMLKKIKEHHPSQVTKSSIMVGLGETFEQVIETLTDLRQARVDIVTIGQYLQPTSKQVKVKEWVSPTTFQEYEKRAKEIGIHEVVAGPFVRSSYKARPITIGRCNEPSRR